MGCGCNKARANVSAGAMTAKGVGTQTPRVSVPEGAKGACMKMYDELSLLDRKIIQLHKKFKWSEKGYKLAQLQKVLRSWVRDLPNGCPDEDDLSELKDYVNPEYDKYFKSESAL